MSSTHPDSGIFETGTNNLRPLLTAVGIFVAVVLVSLIFTGLP